MICAAEAKLTGAITPKELEQLVAAARAQADAGKSVEQVLAQIIPAELRERQPEIVSLIAGMITFDMSSIARGMAMMAERTMAEGKLLAVAKKAGAAVPKRSK